MDFNNVVISGKIISEINPDLLRVTKDGTFVLDFKVKCVKENKKNESDFIDCTAFGKMAENIVKYTEKNSEVLLEGRLCSELYTHNGTDKYRMYLLIKRIKF